MGLQHSEVGLGVKVRGPADRFQPELTVSSGMCTRQHGCSWRPGRDVGCSGAKVTSGCELPHKDAESQTLEKKEVLSTEPLHPSV